MLFQPLLNVSETSFAVPLSHKDVALALLDPWYRCSTFHEARISYKDPASKYGKPMDWFSEKPTLGIEDSGSGGETHVSEYLVSWGNKQ